MKQRIFGRVRLQSRFSPLLASIYSIYVLGSVTSPSSAHATNRVIVQSKTFGVDTDGDTVGILIENDINITGLVLPLEMRTVSGSAFTRPPFTNPTFRWQETAGGRVRNSPLSEVADQSGNELWPGASVAKVRFAVPEGPNCSSPPTNPYSTPAPQCDGISPDALLWAAVSTGAIESGHEVYLTPGVDATPSYEIVFPVNGNPGTFVVDTCCTRPNNHLCFVDEFTDPVVPQFVKGVITLTAPCDSLDPVLDCDNDGRFNADDNCPTVHNPNQEDLDGDGVGDACDNCVSVSNPSQGNADSDDFGDACDNCAAVANDDQSDSDGDHHGNLCDNCPSISNPSQADFDEDGIGDACDCQCACHGDPGGCNRVHDIIDVIAAIYVAFSHASAIPDFVADCPTETTDVDCSGGTDIVDIVKFVSVVFRNVSAASEFCVPCP